MRIVGLLTILLVCMIGNASATAAVDGQYTLYLVRHAEKLADDGDDPALTNAGRHRSEQLANWLRDKGITDIWSSDYRRSRDTARPLASSLGLDLTLYDPANLPALARVLRENRHNALIVGHSNTTPDLARLLCVCFIRDMDDSDYDQLIVITITGNEPHVEILSQQGLFSALDDS
ncbi:MAG: histidine phosphatase family protein [Lysobacterales bacterium]